MLPGSTPAPSTLPGAPCPPYPVLHVVAGQDDAAFPPLLPLVLRDDPQRLVLLAGLPPDPQHHPVAAPCLVVEHHADGAPGQIDGGADEPGTLAFPPSTALQLQVIPAICSRKKTWIHYFTWPLATSVSPPAGWLWHCSAGSRACSRYATRRCCRTGVSHQHPVCVQPGACLPHPALPAGGRPTATESRKPNADMGEIKE